MSLSIGLAIGARPLEPLELALLRAGHRIEWRAHSADEAISLLAEREFPGGLKGIGPVTETAWLLHPHKGD